MPVLLIAGEKAALLPSKKTAIRLKSIVSHTKVHILKDIGHVIINQTDKILSFLTSD